MKSFGNKLNGYLVEVPQKDARASRHAGIALAGIAGIALYKPAWSAAHRASSPASPHRKMVTVGAALFAMYYNFIGIHKMLRTTPAIAAGMSKRLWETGDIR